MCPNKFFLQLITKEIMLENKLSKYKIKIYNMAIEGEKQQKINTSILSFERDKNIIKPCLHMLPK